MEVERSRGRAEDEGSRESFFQSGRVRRVAAIVAAVVVALASVVTLTRFDGLHATDASTGDSTRWFVDRESGRLALVDGYSGTTLARLHPGTNRQRFDVVEGPAGAFVLYDRSSEAVAIDNASLKLGEATPIAELTATHKITTVTRRGLTVIDADTGNGTLFDRSAAVTPFGSPLLEQPTMTPDGALWGIDGEDLVRLDGTDTERTPLGTSSVELSRVGDHIIVLDRSEHRVRFADGEWYTLPSAALAVDSSELVLQEPGPAAECGWVAAHDAMWCVSADGIERTVGMEHWVSVTDRLAVSGKAAVIVTTSPSDIIQFNPATGAVVSSSKASVPTDAVLDIATGDGLIWIEDVGGQLIWSANQWTLQSARKDDDRAPLLGAKGETIDVGNENETLTASPDATDVLPQQQPDNNGIDDPPVAIDDVALVRSGSALPLVATANDYDPDGEAVVIESATSPAHGSTVIASATTISYQPEPGFVGSDSFDYSIVDGDGDSATATATINVVGADHPNEPPVAVDDWGETIAGSPIVLDVLANDYDPERDPLEIMAERAQDVAGTLRRVPGPSGLEAIEFVPDSSISTDTELTFTYVAQDAYGGVSKSGTVTVVVRPPGSANLPPLLIPDSVRAPATTQVRVPVLANDRDPDGDQLTITDLAVPGSLDARIDGNTVLVSAKTGARDLEMFSYSVDDGNGHTVTSTVLVLVEPAANNNRPPVAVPDLATAIAGQRSRLRPLVNDFDPDGDDIQLTRVMNFHSDEVPDVTVEMVDGEVVLSVPPWSADAAGTGSFAYEISDGRGHTASATVTVKILPRALDEAPIAVDDVVTTQRDESVTLDVLKNDAERSGQQPSLVGDPACRSGGTASRVSGGLVQFVPPLGEVGTFRCVYTVANPQGLTATARIIVTVLDESYANRPPEPKSDAVEVMVGEQVSIYPLANDSDPDGDTLSLEAVEDPASGATRVDGKAVRFTAPDQAGMVSFAYQVGDNNGGVSKGQITVNVRPSDTPPLVARDDDGSAQLPGSGKATLDVLANDVPPDPSITLSLASASLVAGPGSVAIKDDRLVFSFSSGATGSIVANYTVRSSDGQTATAQARMTLITANTAPTAPAVSIELRAGASTSVALDVRDLENDRLSIELLKPTDVGGVRASISGDVVSLSAGANAYGGTFGYRVTDEHGLSAEGQISVTVPAPPPPGQNAPSSPGGGSGGGAPQVDDEPETTAPPTTTLPPLPECTDDLVTPSYELSTHMGVEVAAFGPVVGDVIETTAVESGTIDLNTGKYRPAPDFSGYVHFDYTATNQCGDISTGSVSIQVNIAPIANSIERVVEGELVIPIGELATDREALTITSVSVSPPEAATAVAWQVGGTSVKLIGSKMPESKPVMISVTVTDPGQLTAEARITANRTPPPADPSNRMTFPTTSLELDANIAPSGWILDEVEAIEPQGFDFTVKINNDQTSAHVRLDLPRPNRSARAKFNFSLVSANGERFEGVATIAYEPPPTTTTSTSTTTTTNPGSTTTTTTNPGTNPGTTTTTTTKPPATTTTTTTKPPATTTTTTTKPPATTTTTTSKPPATTTTTTTEPPTDTDE